MPADPRAEKARPAAMRATIRALLLVILVTLVGLAAAALWVLDQGRINGPLYRRLVVNQNARADVLPPPAFIIESYLVALQMLDEPDPGKLAALKQRGDQLEREYRERQAFWSRELPAGEAKRQLCALSYAPALEFFRARDDAFVPAVLAGRRDEALTVIRERLAPAYAQHRQAIDALVALTDAASAAIDHDTQTLAAQERLVVTGAVIAVLGSSALIFFLIRRRIFRPLDESLSESEERYRTLVHHAPDAILLADIGDGLRIVAANRRACELLGCARERLVTLTPADFSVALQPDGRAALAAIERHQVALEAGEQVVCDWLIRRQDDGAERLCEMRLVRLTIAGRAVLRTSLVDITERRQAELLLRESEDRYRSLCENNSVGIWHIDAAGHTRYLNRAMCALLELDSQDQLAGITYHRFFSAASLAIMMAEHAKRAHNQASAYEVELIGAAGSRRRVVVSGAPLLGPDGAVSGMIGTFTDVTSGRLAEAALRESEEQHRVLVANAPDAIMLTDVAQGLRIIEANARACELLGATRDELLAATPHAFSADPQPDGSSARAAITANLEVLRGGGQVMREWLINRFDGGGQRLCELRLVSLTIRGRAMVRSSLLDITERKRAEQAALAAESEATVGRMAGRVAHEVNNPLEAIKVYIEPLRSRVKDRPEVGDGLTVIDQQVDRIARLVRSLLDFVRQRHLNRQNARLDEVLRTVIELFRPRFEKQGKRLEVDLPADLPSGAIDIDGVQQVLINLLENGLAAIPHGSGWMRVSARAADGFLDVQIEDNGPGLGADPEQLFKPFVTTKANGTGLGLAVARRICEAHQGRLVGANRPDGGARFELRLRVDAPADAGTLPGGEIQV